MNKDFCKTVKFKKIRNGQFRFCYIFQLPHTVISNSEKLTHPIVYAQVLYYACIINKMSHIFIYCPSIMIVYAKVLCLYSTVLSYVVLCHIMVYYPSAAPVV